MSRAIAYLLIGGLIMTTAISTATPANANDRTLAIVNPKTLYDPTPNGYSTAVIVPAGFAGYAEDDRNLLALAKAAPGQPLVYYAGAAWSRAGEITSRQAWSDYVAAMTARVRAPVKVSLSTAR